MKIHKAAIRAPFRDPTTAFLDAEEVFEIAQPELGWI